MTMKGRCSRSQNCVPRSTSFSTRSWSWLTMRIFDDRGLLRDRDRRQGLMSNLKCCHSERSEDSAFCGELQIPRCARDDNELDVGMTKNFDFRLATNFA